MIFFMLVALGLFLLCDKVFFSFILFCVSFFMFVGVVTVLERKLLSFVGCREGPTVGAKGLFVFFFDFIKFYLKNSRADINLFVSFYCFFIFFLLFFLLPLSIEGVVLFNGFNIMLLVDAVFVVFRVFFFCLFPNKFVASGNLRLKLASLWGEVLSQCFYLPIFCVFSIYGLQNWSEIFSFFSIFDFLLFLPIFILYLVFSVLQVSRPPFDYFESESEVLGGNVTDLGGVGFVVWSLIEYGEIVFKCFFTVSFFLPPAMDSFVFYLISFLLMFGFLVLRGMTPRFSFFESIYFQTSKVSVILFFMSLFYTILILFVYAF